MILSSKKIYLCQPDNTKRYILNGVQTDTVDFYPQIKGYSELSFDVNRFLSIDGQLVESNGYEELKSYMKLYLEDIGYFIMEPPVTSFDGNYEYKSITAYSAEKEFESRDWVGIKINTGESDSMEYFNTDESNKDEYGFAKRYVTLVNYTDENLSFLHQILKKMSTVWHIGYISSKLLDAKVPWLEIDSENLYAVMTSEVGPRMSCLFIFDYLNFEINVIHKDELDKIDLDTGIYIGFRNLENNVQINVNNDSIFTRFSVKGDGELEFRDVNYGDNTIINLDYFLGEPYMEEETAQKYRDWQEFRDAHREEYIDLTRQQLELTERRYERVYRVPSDEAYWSNWENINEEGLAENLAYFRNQIELLQISVEPVVEGRTEEDMYIDGKYVPLLKHGDYPYYVDKLQWNHNYTIHGFSNTTVDVTDENAPTEHIYVDRAQMEHCGYEIVVNYTFKYHPETIEEQTNHELYLQALYDQVNIYGGYYTYYEIINYIIPYILIAYDNLGKIDDDKEEPDTDIADAWELYGLEELKGVRDSYIDKMKALSLYSKDWDDMTDEEKAKVMLNYADDDSGERYEQLAGRKEYVKYKTALGNEETEGTIYYQIKALEDEIAEIDAQLEIIDSTSLEYQIIMNLWATNEELQELEYLDSSLIEERQDFLFDEDELNTFHSLLKDTDYTNSNILATSIFSVEEQLQAEKDLFEDAADKLSEVSQPQYTFSINMDNFFRLPEYESWAEEFEPYQPTALLSYMPPLGMLKFIHVEIRDDYPIKLRVVGYRWNPCEITPDLTIQFSNFITSRSGRSDLTELLSQENNRGSKNSIKIGNGSAESAQEYCNNLMELLKNNSIFTKAVTNIAGNVSGALDVGAVQGIISSSTVPIMNIVGTSEQIADFITNAINNASNVQNMGNAIATKVLEADQGIFNSIITKVITFGKDGITEITKDTIKTSIINAAQIRGSVGEFEQLATNIFTAGSAQINNIIADQIDASEINVSHIVGDSGEFKNFFVQHLNARDADIRTLIANAITADTVAAKLGSFTQANVDTLFANNAFINSLLARTTSTINSTVNTGYILNAIIGHLSVSDLTAGDIVLTNAMRIISENGNLVMNGNALQITGTDSNGQEYVGIQLGYDTNEIPSLILRNENGATVLTPEGITANAIADGLIINNMIHDSTIDKEKLNFSVIEANEYGGIDIHNIYNGDGGVFGDEWVSFTEETRTALDNLAASNNTLELKGDYIFKETNGQITPDQITIEAKIRGDLTIDKWYVNGVENTIYVAYNKQSITIPSSEITNRQTLTVKVVSTSGLYDTMTLYRVADGINGESAYSVIITSSKGSIFDQADTTTCECTVYYGTQEVTPTSYQWVTIKENGTEWETIGNERTVNVNVSNESINQRLKCIVEV